MAVKCDATTAKGHRYIHDQPEYAYERGWLLHRETV